MKKHIKTFFIILLFFSLLLLLLCGKATGDGIRHGLRLAYRSVLPALFPAAVICGILCEMLEYIPLPPNWALWLTAQLCGFPLGIKSVCRAYQRGLIDKAQAHALSLCCTNASPAFLILYVGEQLMGSRQIGSALFWGQCILSFIVALVSGALKPSARPILQDRSLAIVFANGISSAAIGSLGLTAYICFFSAVGALLMPLPLFEYLYGFLELTGGISLLNADDLYLCCAMVGFSGISVLLQNTSYLTEAGLPAAPMVYGKILYGILLPVIIFLIKSSSLLTLSIFPFIILFLISFDKCRKTRYNKMKVIKT